MTALPATATAATMAKPKPNGPAMCSTCGERFANLEDMRHHYASAWHQHNVRLRVDGRPPLTRREFNSIAPSVATPATAGDVSVTRGPTSKRVVTTQGVPAASAGDAAEDNESSATSAAAGAEAKPMFHCKLCKKVFHSVQTLQSHVRSTEHLVRKQAKILARDSQAGSVLSSTSLGSAALGLNRRYKTHQRDRLVARETLAAVNHADPAADPSSAAGENGGAATAVAAKSRVPVEERELDVSQTRCFFCGLGSATLKDNLRHMLAEHQFAIPLVHRCKDLPGLMDYLARKINGLLCLVCNDKSRRFASLEALRAHMREQQHDMVVLSSEYADFYTGTLDDGDAAAALADKGQYDGEGRLVLAVQRGRKQVLPKGESFTIGRKYETPVQKEERRAITAAAAEANAVIVRERQEALAPREREHQKIMRYEHGMRQKADMQNGIRNNKLHPKGFDGEGERI